jgi:hypothetical protein
LPRSEKQLLIEQIRREIRADDRYVDCGARLVVYQRDAAGKPVPFRSLLRVYGGVYDRVQRRYLTNPDGSRVVPAKVHEIACHEGQVRFLTYRKRGVRRVVAKGAMGAGKTESGVRRAFINALERPNSNGGIVAPINNQRTVVWDKFMSLVEATGLIDEVSSAKKQIRLVNGVVIDVLATRKSRRDAGSPMQGRSWDWCVVDESSSADDSAHEEIAARGRTNAANYVVYECTTNDDYAHFVLRMKRYELQPEHYVIMKYYGHTNPFVPLENWETLRDTLSDRDYRRKVLLEDIPPERLLYPRFNIARHLRPLAPIANSAPDITYKLVKEKWDVPARFIIAQDFGVLVTTSIVLRCFAWPTANDRAWFAVDEITSYSEYSDRHAKLIKQRYNPEELIVVADPHMNTRESDRSDYQLFKDEGLRIYKAAQGNITRRHRIAMLNSMLEDGHGKTHFYIDADAGGHTRCKKLTQSFLSLQYDMNGNPETDRKDKSDMTHWTAAVGYGVYPWENLRGGSLAESFSAFEQQKRTRIVGLI